MRFQIRLVDEVDAILVAQIVPARVVGIVASADGVDIEALHENDVFDHALGRESAPVLRVMLMAIDAAQADGLAIHAQAAIDCLYLPEANAGALGLDRDAGSILESNDKGVEIRIFRGPFARGGDVGAKAGAGDFAILRIDESFRVKRRGKYGFGCGVEKLRLAGISFAVDIFGLAKRNTQVEGCVLIVAVKSGCREEIADLDIGSAQESHIAKNAAQPPHVLVLDPRGVAPASDNGREAILAREECMVRY